MRSKDQQLLDDIFDYIVKYKSENDISPSNTDVANQFGLHRSKANRYIQELQTQGKLQINGHRSIRIVSDEFTEPTVKVPLLGNIACGAPIFADGTVRDYQRIPESWTNGRECFLLTAQGDSMINAGIDDGDQVLVEVTHTADEGSIVVALIDDEATLKRFYLDKENQKILLVPENDKYETRIVDYCVIQGIARKVIKNLV